MLYKKYSLGYILGPNIGARELYTGSEVLFWWEIRIGAKLVSVVPSHSWELGKCLHLRETIMQDLIM